MKTSISFRLTCWFSAVFLLGFVTFGVAVWFDLGYQLAKGRDRTLSRRGQRLTDLLEAARNDSLAERDRKFEEFAEAMPEGNLIHFYDARGARIYPEVADPPDFPWPMPQGPPGDSHRNLTYGGRPFRVLIRNKTVNGQSAIVMVAGQLEDNQNLLERFSTGLLAATPPLLLLSALCGYLLSRRALRPVDQLTVAVRSISIGNLSRRLPIYQTGDELQRLAETCNDMLARLEDAIARISRFTADASHELRNPISLIRILAEDALREPELAQEARLAFEDILAESIETSRLVEDLLILARADAGRMEVRLEPLDLGELVVDVCEKVRPLADKKSQTLTVQSISGRALEIAGDRSSLRRLIWTLLDNAVKYTPQGGRIEVALQPTKTQARVSVKDSGIGIPRELLPRIFERFFRADPSRAQAEGTGLGLAIAKWIADVHHATISAQSEEGVGTEFRVVFERSQIA